MYLLIGLKGTVMISQTAEYALRAMVFLAMRGAAATTVQIAEVTKVPVHYLSKILQQLGRCELVSSQRGIGGGFVLSRPIGKISVLDIVNAVDPIQKIETCPLGLEFHGLNLCPLHKRLSEATCAVEEAYASSTLAELVAESKTPLCSSVPLAPANRKSKQ
jgi:Rrf2 family nitric oxide-sensitive transcriptional repressor